MPIVFVTGLLSYAAYNPDLAFNDQTGDSGIFRWLLFDWPTSPSWLYRVTQGTHVTLGLVLVPVLLAKLWSVIPKLFTWPPITSPAQILERLSLLALVGGAIFEFVTGILNIQYFYVFPGSFYRLHYYGAWVFIAGFVVARDPQVPHDAARPEIATAAGRTARRHRAHRGGARTTHPSWSARIRRERPCRDGGSSASSAGVRSHCSR